MKTLRFVLPALLCIAGVVRLQAQTVDEIINKYIDAIGGKEKISGIKSLYKESDIEVMGNTASSTTYILNGKGFKMEMDFNGSKIVQCITDKGGWGVNPMMGQTSAEALPDDQVKSAQSQLAIEGPLVDYAAKGNKIELLGQEAVNGANTYKLKVTTKDNVQITINIDATTYYPLKAVSKATVSGQEIETTTTFSNYQKTDYGFVVPFAQELTLPQGITLSMKDKKVEVNKDIDPAVFEKPKS
jgi:hypothetical protein